MSVKIRLQRGGSSHTPHYRIVVAESRFRRDGRFIEVIGTYNPVAKKRRDKCAIKLERADHWLGVGAQPSDTVRGLINRFRRGFYEVEEPEAQAVTPKATPAPVPDPVPEENASSDESLAEEAASEATSTDDGIADDDSQSDAEGSDDTDESQEESEAAVSDSSEEAAPDNGDEPEDAGGAEEK